MDFDFTAFPERNPPYIVGYESSKPVTLINGPFRAIGPVDGTLEGDLVFRWLPKTAVEIEGRYEGTPIDINAEGWCLVITEASPPTVPILITQAVPGSGHWQIKAIVNGSVSLGTEPFEELRFCLTNFPHYLGKRIRSTDRGTGGTTLFRGRLLFSSDQGTCVLDSIPESEGAAKAAERAGDHVVSHVGVWRPCTGLMPVKEAEEVLTMFHFWFSFLRGTWAAPVFPEGLLSQQVAWRQLAPWRIQSGRKVQTWLPELKDFDLTPAFRGFTEKWRDSSWHDPLMRAISWYVEANSHGLLLESRIVLAQVALELLASVRLVEAEQIYTLEVFSKEMSAARRIRELLVALKISPAIPDYLEQAQTLCRGKSWDGPNFIASVRNALAHPVKANREKLEDYDRITLLQCWQLALHYVELSLLAICGYEGHYARRGWCGWKGDDEVLVPWALPR